MILEVRAGTGGDEAALFAGDLLEMYRRYCEQKHFRWEVLDFSPGDAGGFRDRIDRRAIKTALHEQFCRDVEQARVTPHRLLPRGTAAGPPPRSARLDNCFLRHPKPLVSP